MTEYRTVIYHSREWSELVEQGWLTVTVEPRPFSVGLRYATMIRQR